MLQGGALSIVCCLTMQLIVEPAFVGAARELAAAEPAAEPAVEPSGESGAKTFVTESLRGRVVFTAEAMARLHNARSVPEALDKSLALQTSDGRLVPLLEDVRGRAFRTDERLRNINVELLVRRYPGSPVVQVVSLYEITPDGTFELDYWCDVCAIAMLELKTCECCQGDIELRRRRVAEPAAPAKP